MDTQVSARPPHASRCGLLRRALVGAVSGAVATVPMTLVMAAMHRRLPFWQRYRLPPRTITMRLARRAGVAQYLGEPERSVATVASHVGYGALAGAVYGAASGDEPRHPLTGGALFGLALWAVSYLGWLPATGVMRPATEHADERNALMITSHLVFGVGTAATAKALTASR